MNKSYKRALLLTGVSFCTPALAAPAIAAAPNQERAAGDTLVIGNIGEPSGPSGSLAAGANNQFTIAAASELSSLVSSTSLAPGSFAHASVVLSCTISGACSNSGPIVQRATNIGSSASNALTNDGRLEIGELARAQGASALASALLATAIWQHASGADASNALSNGGTLQVSALANAIATVGSAGALVSLPNGGLTQTAIASGASGLGQNHLSNGGSLIIDARAAASAEGSASALGQVSGGIVQKAFGIGSAKASNELDNMGTIAVDLSASADAGADAFARATAASAIVQMASGRDAHDFLDNEGSIAVSVGAKALGMTSATALAFLHSGIFETAGASGTGASAGIELRNEGSLSLVANAEASAAGVASAEAVLERGIVQLAGADGSAAVAIANSGNLAMAASASAAGASASAWVIAAGGIVQAAHGAAAASALLTNAASGAIHIGVAGAASATDGDALALVRLGVTSSGAGAIFQDAHATEGSAEVSLANAGSIALTADASAHASGTTSAGYARAIGNASISGAIQEVARADRGSAIASLSNVAGASGDGGSISISAAAHGEDQSGVGYAYAGVSGAIVESARGLAAQASLANGGSISIAAAAQASGSVGWLPATIGVTSATFFLPDPGAKAYINYGLIQQASASAGRSAAAAALDARAILDNSGTLSISAIAADTAEHTALALAELADGVLQRASAQGGQASAAISNSGGISIIASAEAHGSRAASTGTEILHTPSGSSQAISLPIPGAYVAVQGAIVQEAFALGAGGRGPGSAASTANAGSGGGAIIHLDNEGAIDILARAGAYGSALASASVSLSGGLVQDAVASLGSAGVTLDNEGTLSIGAFATASAAGTAVASVLMRPAILQVAGDSAKGTDGSASDRFENGGSVAFIGAASAAGARASALAGVEQALFQVAQDDHGDAVANLDNEGKLGIAGIASAEGTSVAIADAAVGSPRSGAIWQTAQAPAGLALETLANSGTIEVYAIAGASARSGWAQAVGHVMNGVVQNAVGPQASALLANSGTLAIQAAGNANGHSATANGVIGGGILQFVDATSSIPKSSRDFAPAAAGTAQASIVNSGSIVLSGVGVAEATGPGQAMGFVGGGLDQFVFAPGARGSASVDNEGDISILAAASASGAGAEFRSSGWTSVIGGANAFAAVSGGVVQVVGATGAAAAFANSGSFSVAAIAGAKGAGISTVAGTGSAAATVAAGPIASAVIAAAVSQNVTGGNGGASATITNSGSFVVAAGAHSTGTGVGPTLASARDVDAILQIATASSGAASITLDNEGSIDALMGARATALQSATASAHGGSVLHQQAAGRDPSATIDNRGTIDIVAFASAAAAAAAATTDAYAFADGFKDVAQTVVAYGNRGSAAAGFTNESGGMLEIAVEAAAYAQSGTAFALAALHPAFYQYAEGDEGAAAGARFANDGNLAIAAVAHATARGSALAHAAIVSGIDQFAAAYGGGDDSGDFTNSGTIDQTGFASAVGHVAKARVSSTGAAIVQSIAAFGSTAGSTSSAFYNPGGDASGLLSNSGVIELNNIAKATSVAGSALLGGGLANAFAGDGGILVQFASAPDGAASASFLNSGSIAIAEFAQAKAVAGSARASAATAFAINQALAGGEAAAELANSGILSVTNVAQATGEKARAVAGGFEAVHEESYALSGDASAQLTNSGTIEFVDFAQAKGDASARANAGMTYALVQDAHAPDGGTASAKLDNDGKLGIDELAIATGVKSASADAEEAGGLLQDANAHQGGLALGAIGNEASFTAIASAAAHASQAHAFALVDSAVHQSISAVATRTGFGSSAVNVPGGDALATISNDGTIDILARAVASGAGSARATAQASNVFIQIVNAYGGVSGTFSNDGAIAIDAVANASGSASAAANIRDGIRQIAGNAQTVAAFSAHHEQQIEFANSGTLTLLAHASAASSSGRTAAARAHITSAIVQIGEGPGHNGAELVNQGSIEIAAVADASAMAGASSDGLGAGLGIASAHVGAGSSWAVTGAIAEDVSGSSASGKMTNCGTISIVAKAAAQGIGASAFAGVSEALAQHMTATQGNASATIANSGTLTVAASASAEAGSDAASARGAATGIGQQAYTMNGAASDILMNSGAIAVIAAAYASGSGDAAASASAFGARQFASAAGSASEHSSASLSFGNEGTFSVSADAAADGAMAFASATIATGIREDALAEQGEASASLTNSGTIAMSVGAEAVASAVTGLATALVNVLGIDQTAAARTSRLTTASSGNFMHYSRLPTGPATVSLDNSGILSFAAEAHASAKDMATSISGIWGVLQQVTGTNAEASVGNQGTMAGLASAEATGGQSAYALASVIAVNQFVDGTGTQSSLTATASGAGHFERFRGGLGPAHAALTNSGTISLLAHAHAVATDTALAASHSTAGVGAEAEANGIGQYVAGTDATASLANDGLILLQASASATGFQYAGAQMRGNLFAQGASAVAGISSVNWTASGVTGLAGFALTGDAAVNFSNSGVLDLKGTASAKAGAFALLGMYETGGNQVARGATGEVSFENSGSFDVQALGKAVGAYEEGFILAVGEAQLAEGEDSALASIVNSGTVAVDASLDGTALTGSATDKIIAVGLRQESSSPGVDSTKLVNSGLISVAANAKATAAGGSPLAVAWAGADFQNSDFDSLEAAFDNSGRILVSADASAIGDGAAYASAAARGLVVGAANITADVVNSGLIAAEATAHASGTGGSAIAFAVGMSLTAAANRGTSGPAGSLAGTIVNKGDIRVSAKLDSANSGALAASATGIAISATRNNATLVNSGLIDVEAATAHGGPPNASGVRVLTASAGDLAQSGDVFTFANDGGTIIARQSTDGGDHWHRGMAIDVAAAPNASVVNLIGDGTIYGDIAVQSGDEINVRAGTAYFDGIINPAYVPASGITAAALDSGLSGVGTLNVGDGGNLVLADPRITGMSAMYDGPAYALVDTLNIASDGKLTFDLEPVSGGIQPIGSYPQVFADTANLAGTLVADVTAAGGLFADSYSWQNLIDANMLNGRFDRCVLGGPYAKSVLLTLRCSYDSDANVDLSLTRNAFGSVAGLNGNGVAVGSGLEAIYSTGLSGGAANMFHDLFLIGDPSNYAVALNQLSGSLYANYLSSFPSRGVHYDDITARATDCELPSLGGSVLECRTSPVHVWGELDYQTSKSDGDSEAGSAGSKGFTGLLGIDTKVGDAAIAGLDAGSVSNHFRDHQFGDEAKGDGWQVGAYAAYDPGAFFVKGVATYSSLSGHSSRTVNFAKLAPGATFGGRLSGNPDVRMWTAGLHGGARLSLAAHAVVTPYLDYDYVHAKLGGFTEDGLEGADLKIEGGSSSHSFMTAGARWATKIGRLVPQLDLGYRYRFGSARSSFEARFNDASAATDGSFDVASAAQKKGSFLAGLSVGGMVGPVDVRIGYEGEFGRGLSSHSGSFKLVLPLGGHSAPPAARRQ